LNASFARRLLIVTALEIAVALGVLVIAGALFAFGSFINSVRSDVNATSNQLTAALESSPENARSGRQAATLAAGRFLRSDLVVLIFDRDRRYDVFRPHRADPLPVVQIARRTDPLPNNRSNSVVSRAVVGLATAFGLQVAKVHVGEVDVFVRESDASLTSATLGFVWPVAVALLLAFAIGYAIARVLTQQVLRPLVDVTDALERFASGDLTPQPIAADSRHQLGQLAVAYNGAVEQMERAFAERERANAAMRQFIADASHQLRTPLTVLRGFIAILRKGDLRSPEDRERILETMNRQSLIMGSLIEKLMLLDRWEEHRGERPGPVDVGRLVEDVVSPIAEANPSRTVRIAAPAGELAAIDPIDLTYALTNIVDNALKYTRGAIDVAVRHEAGRLTIEIADEGPGMTATEVAHAFDRFFRGARRDVDGSGLGLAIARRAVERAGGTLSLESDPAAGSTFTIALPVVAQSAPAAPRRIAAGTVKT
jgi:two-component system OmpR family sensor kinase